MSCILLYLVRRTFGNFPSNFRRSSLVSKGIPSSTVIASVWVIPAFFTANYDPVKSLPGGTVSFFWSGSGFIKI